MVLVLLKGFPGSGKSTLGRALSRRLLWPLIDKDDVKDIVDKQVQGETNGLAYDVMLNIVRRQLLQGLNVICDSPLTHHMTYEHAKAIAMETQTQLVIVECFCSDEQIWSRRINARKERNLPAHHMTAWERVQAYRRQYTVEAGYTITEPHLVVDTVRPLDECVADVIDWLKSHKSMHGTISKGANMDNRHYSMNIQWSDEDQTYIVTVSELPGCKTHGTTYEEAVKQGQDAIDSWIMVAQEVGRLIPPPNKIAV